MALHHRPENKEVLKQNNIIVQSTLTQCNTRKTDIWSAVSCLVNLFTCEHEGGGWRKWYLQFEEPCFLQPLSWFTWYYGVELPVSGSFFNTEGFFHGFNFITNSFVVWAWLSLIFQILIGIQWNIDSGSNINPVRIPDILEKIVYLCFLEFERIIKDRGWENWRHFTVPLSFLNYVQTWIPHKLISRDFKFSQA